MPSGNTFHYLRDSGASSVNRRGHNIRRAGLFDIIGAVHGRADGCDTRVVGDLGQGPRFAELDSPSHLQAVVQNIKLSRRKDKHCDVRLSRTEIHSFPIHINIGNRRNAGHPHGASPEEITENGARNRHGFSLSERVDIGVNTRRSRRNIPDRGNQREHDGEKPTHLQSMPRVSLSPAVGLGKERVVHGELVNRVSIAVNENRIIDRLHRAVAETILNLQVSEPVKESVVGIVRDSLIQDRIEHVLRGDVASLNANLQRIRGQSRCASHRNVTLDELHVPVIVAESLPHVLDEGGLRGVDSNHTHFVNHSREIIGFRNLHKDHITTSVPTPVVPASVRAPSVGSTSIPSVCHFVHLCN
nr:MAG: capsid protein [ssDNA virus sp.]